MSECGWIPAGYSVYRIYNGKRELAMTGLARSSYIVYEISLARSSYTIYTMQFLTRRWQRYVYTRENGLGARVNLSGKLSHL